MAVGAVYRARVRSRVPMACATRRLSSRWFSSSCLRWHENPLVNALCWFKQQPNFSRASLGAVDPIRPLKCLEEQGPYKNGLYLTCNASLRSQAAKEASGRAQWPVLLVHPNESWFPEIIYKLTWHLLSLHCGPRTRRRACA